MKILRGALKIFRHPKGGSEKIKRGGGLRKFVYFKTNRRWGGAPKKIEPLARGAAKISSFEFQYLHTPPPLPVILNELSLNSVK